MKSSMLSNELRVFTGVKIRKQSEELRELLGFEMVSFMSRNSRLRREWKGGVVAQR